MRKIWLLILIVAISAGVWFIFFRGPLAIRNAPPGPGPIVAFGDSLTHGYGAPPGASYPDQLGKLLGRPIINAGVNGNTVGEAHKRLAADVLARKPALVIVLLGANDYIRRLDLEATFAELERIVTELQAQGAVVAVVGMEGFLPFTGYGKRYAQLARRTGAVYIPDIMGGILGNRALLSDELHPNAQGYDLMANRIATVLRPVLSPIK